MLEAHIHVDFRRLIRPVNGLTEALAKQGVNRSTPWRWFCSVVCAGYKSLIPSCRIINYVLFRCLFISFNKILPVTIKRKKLRVVYAKSTTPTR